MLIECCGVEGWWPSNDPFEISVQAILTQNTNWKNVMKATKNLKEKGLIDPKRMYEAPLEVLEDAIRPAGFYKLKAKRLKEFLEFVMTRLDGDITRLRNIPMEDARNMLLSVHGIGKETADTILLFALNLPIMVVDAYTKRVLRRLGFDMPNNYDEIRKMLEKASPKKDAKTYKLLHSAFDELAKNYCKKKTPICSKCPLEKYCKKLI
ncbi:MAG TPA: endonuclease [Euryarchaeota archaeon]|nr:endonuclease [Euryarchaeota archaeon]